MIWLQTKGAHWEPRFKPSFDFPRGHMCQQWVHSHVQKGLSLPVQMHIPPLGCSVHIGIGWCINHFVTWRRCLLGPWYISISIQKSTPILKDQLDVPASNPPIPWVFRIWLGNEIHRLCCMCRVPSSWTALCAPLQENTTRSLLMPSGTARSKILGSSYNTFSFLKQSSCLLYYT